MNNSEICLEKGSQILYLNSETNNRGTVAVSLSTCCILDSQDKRNDFLYFYLPRIFIFGFSFSFFHFLSHFHLCRNTSTLRAQSADSQVHMAPFQFTGKKHSWQMVWRIVFLIHAPKTSFYVSMEAGFRDWVTLKNMWETRPSKTPASSILKLRLWILQSLSHLIHVTTQTSFPSLSELRFQLVFSIL